MLKIEVMEGTGLEPTPRMLRIPGLGVSESRLNPYVMLDVTEKTDRGLVTRHVDKTVAVRGELDFWNFWNYFSLFIFSLFKSFVKNSKNNFPNYEFFGILKNFWVKILNYGIWKKKSRKQP